MKKTGRELGASVEAFSVSRMTIVDFLQVFAGAGFTAYRRKH
jgi:hypothetical protein